MDRSSIGSIGAINAAIKPAQTSLAPDKSDQGGLFKELLNNAINAVNETDQKVIADQAALATGQLDDLHTLMIDVAKADLAVETLVQLRNKALDAYNEIMKITL